MKKQPNHIASRACVLIGSCLIVVAVLLSLLWQWGVRSSAQKMGNCVDIIRSLIPEVQSTVLEERRDNTMAVLSLDGTDFVGMLEMPRYGSVLPVCASWGMVSKYPSCLSGSIYDGTMQIGGTSQEGQYDFYREISLGDDVYFTDMEGNRYSYAITGIRYEKHADQTTLQREEAALTLFIKNIYAFDYIVIYCNPLV